MKILMVTFRSSVHLKDSQHAHIEVTAQVGPPTSDDNREDARKTLDELKDFVAEELKVVKEGRQVKQPGRFLA